MEDNGLNKYLDEIGREHLISEGNIGLMTAAAKFDASRGTRFVI